MKTTSRWQIADPAPPEFLAANLDLPPLVAQVLWNRGIRTAWERRRFLEPDYERDVHDPFLFRHMARAVERIQRAVQAGERIVIHGDYDADGVCAAAAVWTVLRALGANVAVFLPHRERDGYGLQLATVEQLAKEGTAVIITCDCGISNVAEIGRAQALGMEVIVTDHHTLPPTLPPAFAILHPAAPGETYPWHGLSGGGVAFKLCQALIRRAAPGLEPGFEKWLLDLVSISSVADLVPLRDETRTLVRFGLRVLGKTRRPGLRAIMEAAGVKLPVTATTIGFQIAPRINAAGRMEHASIAFDALTTDDPVAADRLVQTLQQCNTARQRAVEELLGEARERVAGVGAGPIVVSGSGWRLGLLGLVASKLAEEHRRPAFAFADRDGILTGSGRSVPGIDLMSALRTMPEAMTKFGGHAQACGVTLTREQLPAWSELLAAAMSSAGSEKVSPILAVDSALQGDECTLEAVEALERCAPFGMDNPEPVFFLPGVLVRAADSVGAAGKHLRILGEHRGQPRKFIGFRLGDRLASVPPGTRIDLVCNLRTSEWNGRREVEYSVVDFKTTV